jgi:hypothetical protein
MVNLTPAAPTPAAPPTAPPCFVLVVIDNDVNVKVDRRTLSSQIRTHLDIEEQLIQFYKIKGNRHMVVEEIQKRDPKAVIYYQTTAGITELYMSDAVKEDAKKKKSEKNDFVQIGVNLRNLPKGQKPTTLADALDRLVPLFRKAKKFVPQEQKELVA